MNTNKIKLNNTFHRLKLFKCQKITNVYDKNLSILKKISNDLIKLSYFNDKSFDKSNIPLIHNYYDSFINKPNKIKLVKKSKKNILSKNQILNFRDKDKNDSIYKNKNSKYKSLDLLLYQKLSNKKISLENKRLSPISCKNIKNKKYINKKQINESINNNQFKNAKTLDNYFKKKSILFNNKKDKKENHQFSFKDGKDYKNNFNFGTFITEQKPLFEKVNNNNKDKKIILSYKDLKEIKDIRKKISRQNLTNFINDSSELFNKQYNKIINNENNLKTARNNFYQIKTLLLKFDMGKKSIDKQIDYLINEDIDIKKVYKSMRLFHNSLKKKVTTKENDISKKIMISKKNADIINYSECFCNLDDIYFYKHNKSYINSYPLLSKEAIKEPFKKDYKKIIYKSHKEIIEGNALDIRKLVRACTKILNKIK